MLEVAEGICTVQGLQTLFSSDPVANSPRRCCPAGLLLGQTAQRAVGRRAPRSVLGGGAGSALAPQASSSVRRRPACERRMGPSAAAPVSVPGCVRPVPAPGPGLLHAAGRRALLGLLLPPCLVPRTPQPARLPRALAQGLVAPVRLPSPRSPASWRRLPSASTASHLPPAGLSF